MDYPALMDPRTMGILSAAFQGLQASGPQRMPVSLGQVIGQAGQAGLGTYQNAMAEQSRLGLQNLQAQSMMAQMQANARAQQAIDEYAQQVPEKDRARFLANPAEYLKKIGERTKVSPGETVLDGNNVPVYQSAPNAHFADVGGNILPLNPQTGAPMGAGIAKSVTPDAAANLEQRKFEYANPSAYQNAELGIQRGNLGVARANLGIRAAEADPFGMLGIRGSVGGGGGAPAPAPMAPTQNLGAAYNQPAPPPVPGVPQARPQLGNVPIIQQDVHGEDYLKALPQPLADQVKALAEGRMQFPGGFALKSPYWQAMISAVSQYDPSFDAVNFNSRAATRKDFTSGKAANNITAINTAMGHIGTLLDKAEKLKNSDFPAVNTVSNMVLNATGDPRVKEFDVAKGAVANELMRVFRQVGASESEVREWGKTVDAAGSPAQLRGAIKTAVELLHSRLTSLEDQYKKGMGTSGDPLKILNDKAEAIYKKVMGEEDAPTAGTGGLKGPVKWGDLK